MEKGLGRSPQASLDRVHHCLQVLMATVAQAVPFQPLPEPFHRVELRGIGRQQDDLHVGRNLQIVAYMPPGLIHHEEAESPTQNLAHVIKEQVHHAGVDPWQKQADLLAGDRADRAINIKVPVAWPHYDRGPHAPPSPAPPGHRLEPKTPLVKEKDLGFGSFPDYFREFFLKASCSCSSAM